VTDRRPGAAPSDEVLAQVAEIARRRANEPGPLLEILHEVQTLLGCVPPEAIPVIAAALNLSRAEVHGTASFYHHFRQSPSGEHVLRLCRAEACQSMGALELEALACERLSIAPGQTSPDGSVTLETVYCLGLCACAPAAMLDGEVHGRLDRARLEALLAQVSAGGAR
jgi:formate dehydrogenase subunit gamma